MIIQLQNTLFRKSIEKYFKNSFLYVFMYFTFLTKWNKHARISNVTNLILFNFSKSVTLIFKNICIDTHTQKYTHAYTYIVREIEWRLLLVRRWWMWANCGAHRLFLIRWISLDPPANVWRINKIIGSGDSFHHVSYRLRTALFQISIKHQRIATYILSCDGYMRNSWERQELSLPISLRRMIEV